MLQPPHDVEVEKSVISALIMGDPRQASILIARLSESCFFHPSHQVIFSAIQKTPLPLDSLTVWGTIQKQGQDHKVQMTEIVDIIRFAEDVMRPEVLVETLIALRHRRELIHLGDHLQRQAFDTMTDPSEAILEAQDGLHRVSLDGRADDGESWEVIGQWMGDKKPFKGNHPDSMGWWGIGTLDSVCSIPAGEYVTIGARPGVGKTALMTQIAVESARKGLKTLVVTLELPKMAMRARIASYMTTRSIQELRKGGYTSDDAREVNNEPNTLAHGRIQAPSPGIPWSKLDAMIRYEVDRYGIQLVLLDQFDKIGRGQIGRGSSEAYAFGAVSQGIMALAKDLGIGFILLCQLKGDAEGREPTLADHADSDRPGKDPAVVVHLWRDKDGKTMAKIQKNRDGGFVGKRIALDFRGDCQRFIEVIAQTNAPMEPVKPVSGWAVYP